MTAVLALYARALLPRRRPDPATAAIPERTVVLPRVAPDPKRLARYARVVGHPAGDGVPPCYPHLIAFPAAMDLMTRRDFPFPVLGLVHVANRIDQLRPIGPDERLSHRVTVHQPRPHPKGSTFEVLSEAEDGSGVVWRSTATYLSRHPRPGAAAAPDAARGGKEATGEAGEAGTEHEGAWAVEEWTVPAATGRRYAAVSGDRNPIHLHPLTARPFGFRRALAHGMWTKARCLAALARAEALPAEFSVTVRFRAPVLLPAHVTFRHRDGAFELRGEEGRREYLRGQISPFAAAD